MAAASLARAAAGSAGLMPGALLMTTKTKILLVVAVGIALAGIPVTLNQFHIGLPAGATAPAAHINSMAGAPVKPSSVVEAPRLPPQATAGVAVAGVVSLPGTTASASGTAIRQTLVAGSSGTAVGDGASRGATSLYANPAIPLGHRIAALRAGAPVTIKPDIEIWETDPANPKTSHIRPDIQQILLKDDTLISPQDYATGTAYYLPGENRFYLVWEKTISSTIHWYGPFSGNPREVLNLPESMYPANTADNAGH